MAKAQISLLKRIYEQLMEDHTDVELVFQDGSTTGNKICLTALSSYFEAMLKCDMTEKRMGVIKLPTTSLTTFQNIMKLCFLGEDVINQLNCFPLLEAADMMMLDHVKSLCLDYLNNNLSLTTDTCVQIWRSLKTFGSEDLARKALQYMVENAAQLSESGAILSLTKSEYVELLSHDDFRQKEDDILRDVQTWIQTNNPSAETMVDLFKLVRFEHISLTYLHKNVIFTSIVKEHEALQTLVEKGFEKHSLKYGEMCTFIDNRISGQMLDVLFILNDSNVLCAACLSDMTWYDLPPAYYNPGRYFAGAVLGQHIYITGGEDRKTSTMLYDVGRKGWTLCPNLKHERYQHCMAVVDDKLYVIGGKSSNTIEEFQQGQAEWQVVGDLGCSLSGPCAETVGIHILVMGRQTMRSAHNKLHCFNTSTHAVCTINTKENSGTNPRSYLDMPNLYLVHHDGSVDVAHVEESTPPTLIFESVARLDRCGTYFGIVYKDGYLIVVTNNDIQKVNIRDGSKESITFRNSKTNCNVLDILKMRVPRICL